MTNPHQAMRRLWDSLTIPRLRHRGSTPVNKVSASGSQRRLPQIDNPLLLGAAAVGALGAGLTVTRLRSGGRGGRNERFAAMLGQALSEAVTGAASARHKTIHDVRVEVLEGFGKLPLVSVDVVVDEASPLWSDVVGQRILDTVGQSAWHNPELAPVGVRARIISQVDDRELMDMSALGYEGEAAHPEELLSRYGAPAYDPLWKG